jgi:hypothetical protein
MSSYKCRGRNNDLYFLYGMEKLKRDTHLFLVILCNINIHYRIYNSPSLIPFLSQMIPVQIFLSYFYGQF